VVNTDMVKNNYSIPQKLMNFLSSLLTEIIRQGLVRWSRVYARCGPALKAQAAPFGLALDHTRPWQKEKIGRRKGKKKIFLFPSNPK